MFEVIGKLTGQVLNSLMCMKFDLRRDICLGIIQLVKKQTNRQTKQKQKKKQKKQQQPGGSFKVTRTM